MVVIKQPQRGTLEVEPAGVVSEPIDASKEVEKKDDCLREVPHAAVIGAGFDYLGNDVTTSLRDKELTIGSSVGE